MSDKWEWLDEVQDRMVFPYQRDDRRLEDTDACGRPYCTDCECCHDGMHEGAGPNGEGWCYTHGKYHSPLAQALTAMEEKNKE